MVIKFIKETAQYYWDLAESRIDTETNLDTYKIAMLIVNEKQLTAIQCHNFYLADQFRQIEDELGEIYKSIRKL